MFYIQFGMSKMKTFDALSCDIFRNMGLHFTHVGSLFEFM